ncbi:hypothetical protein ACFPT7_24390 [Acidicapsa dinghuensis]|uniref:Phosphotransferase system, HPr-related protein n=1 Tax=Acidicapsa dinghuensis TaxID=2218256 RepID=A0ABW1EQB1_9BACT|nr:hypothetical protein [Acidicapsa dinghuensis]
MPIEPKRKQVDLSESSVYGNEPEPTPARGADDIATEASINRLEETVRGGEKEREESRLYQGRTGRDADKLDASTDEEIDALELDLYQTDSRSNTLDGSGRIVDDVAEERLAEFTEVGPDLDDEGAESVEPGNEDTSETLRRHHPNFDIASSDAVVEGNLEPGEEPGDEEQP